MKGILSALGSLAKAVGQAIADGATMLGRTIKAWIKARVAAW